MAAKRERDANELPPRGTAIDSQNFLLAFDVDCGELISGHRVLLVDDWIATGGQAVGARAIVGQAGASWCGAAVIVDGLLDSRLRRDLVVRSLMNLREL